MELLLGSGARELAGGAGPGGGGEGAGAQGQPRWQEGQEGEGLSS